MTYLEIVKEFVLFLKENNTLKAYKENIYKAHPPQDSPNKEYQLYYGMNPLVYLKGEWSLYDIENLISHSFNWMGTDQGQNYWQSLHDKWYEKMKNVKIINEKT